MDTIEQRHQGAGVGLAVTIALIAAMVLLVVLLNVRIPNSGGFLQIPPVSPAEPAAMPSVCVAPGVAGPCS